MLSLGSHDSRPSLLGMRLLRTVCAFNQPKLLANPCNTRLHKYLASIHVEGDQVGTVGPNEFKCFVVDLREEKSNKIRGRICCVNVQ